MRFRGDFFNIFFFLFTCLDQEISLRKPSWTMTFSKISNLLRFEKLSTACTRLDTRRTRLSYKKGTLVLTCMSWKVCDLKNKLL